MSVLILCMVWILGCTRMPQQPDQTDNFVDTLKVGISIVTINNEAVVKSLAKNFPAENVGIMRGDIIVTGDGKKITTGKDIALLLDTKNNGEQVSFVINRNGKQHTFDLDPKMIKERPTVKSIRKLIEFKKKVSIAVLVSDVKNSFPDVRFDWADSIRNSIQSDAEGGLLSLYSDEENFSVVDRSRFKQLLDEFRINQAGFVSDKLRVKIGEMTGATHIMDISFSRFPTTNNRGYVDEKAYRLIDVESGTVLAVDKTTERYRR